jgi:hypothetical protein
LNACSDPNPYSGSITLPMRSSTRWIAGTLPWSERTRGAPDSDTNRAPSAWKVRHASAIRNSTTGRKPSALRRIMSRVQARGLPLSSRTGSHEVTPWTVPASSTAMPTRTRGSMASSTPPSVKPSSGVRLPRSQLAEISLTWFFVDWSASASVTIRNVMPSLVARLRAVRMSCHFLPRNARSGRSTMVSSATWTRFAPTASAVVADTENQAGTRPSRSQCAANTAGAVRCQSVEPTGSPSTIATPACRR